MSTNESSIKGIDIMDSRWQELDNPEANAYRAEVLNMETMYPRDAIQTPWYERTDEHRRLIDTWDRIGRLQAGARQEQEVLDAREKLEELARRLKAYKEEGEALKEWLREQNIPGVDCWVWSISELEDNDVIGDAIKWAASNHNC